MGILFINFFTHLRKKILQVEDLGILSFPPHDAASSISLLTFSGCVTESC